jgi:Chaperone of endosialidase
MYPDGKIQIGCNDLTNTSNNRLVIGDIFSGYISFVYGGSETGSIYRNVVNGTTYATTSDYRLKENLKPVENAIQKVMKLNPVNFNFSGSQTGYLAHEFAEICPYAVKGKKMR